MVKTKRTTSSRRATGVFGAAAGRETETPKRGRGRPRGSPREPLFVRLRPSTVAAVRAEAKARERTISVLVDDLLRRALKLGK